jgi:ABC-type multidrug transport system ATPase subunit
MLEVLNLSHLPSKPKASADPVLDAVSLAVPTGHLLGIIGAHGSGKSTLIGLLAGLEPPTAGEIRFQGHDTALKPIHPNSLGLVAAHDHGLIDTLTVRESMMSAHILRVAGQSHEARVDKVSHLLVGLGLETVASHRVSTLTLTQRRRLKLALALLSDAPLVLCDEFTDGLDVKSEQELAALLKYVVADLPGRIVVHASQSLANLASYDSVLILHEGRVCFHGPARAVAHYFSIANVEELYPRLAKRPAERWGESWSRHRDQYYEAFKLGDLGQPCEERPETSGDLDEAGEKEPQPEPSAKPENEYPAPPPLPSFLTQTGHLIRRRWTLWRRTQREWLEHLALFLACPLAAMLLVAPNTGYLSELQNQNHSPDVLWPAAYTCTMILLVQVLLIMIISLRFATPEIARERPLFERERAAGLRGMAYLAAKLGFLIPLMIAHSAALVLLVDMMGGHLPGAGAVRLLLLVLTGVAFSSLCLGLSATTRSADRAQSHAWKLWAANVILAGALLGFPRPLGILLQPFLTADLGWSGSVDTLSGSVVFAPLTKFVRTWFAPPATAMIWLLVQSALGIMLAGWGLKKRRVL